MVQGISLIEEEEEDDISGDAESEEEELGDFSEDEEAIVARALGKAPPIKKGKKGSPSVKSKKAPSLEDGEFVPVKHGIDDQFLNLDEMNAFLDEQVRKNSALAALSLF